jgi:hypothetical protein
MTKKLHVFAFREIFKRFLRNQMDKNIIDNENMILKKSDKEIRLKCLVNYISLLAKMKMRKYHLIRGRKFSQCYLRASSIPCHNFQIVQY